MSSAALPDFPVTPIQRGKGAVTRNLLFKPPVTSTPVLRISRKAAKDDEVEKGKAVAVLRQQNLAPTVKPSKSQHQKSSQVVNSVESQLLGGRNQPVGVKPVVSEAKSLESNEHTMQATIEKLAIIGKTVSMGIHKTTQRKPGGEVKTRAALMAESKGEGKVKGRLGPSNVKTLDKVFKVASGLRKGMEKSGMGNENAPRVNKSSQNTDSHFVEPSRQSIAVNALQVKSLDSGHRATGPASKSTSSMQCRTGNGKETDWKTLTSQDTASKGLLPKDLKSRTRPAQVNSNSDLRTTRVDSSVNRNSAEIKSSTRALDSRSSEMKESKLKGKSVDKAKSQTMSSADIVQTTACKPSRCVNSASATAEKERISVSAVSEIRIPGLKSSMKINPRVAASRTAAVQRVASEGLTSDIQDSALTKSDSSRSQSKILETLAVKKRAAKRLASPERSSDLEDSVEVTDGSNRQTIPNNKPKKRKVVIEDSEDDLQPASTQPERRFLKQKIPKPKKLLPNSSEEKTVRQAQKYNRRKSVELKDIELKVKPKTYRRWKVASKQTIDFAMATLTQSFDEKFKSQKVDLVSLVKHFEELKTRIRSEISVVKVPTSRQPVNYLALATQEATLEKQLNESVRDVEQIRATIRNCKKSNEKLKILTERLRSERLTTSEAERLYEAVDGRSQSTVA